jgi:hypothetical protein
MRGRAFPPCCQWHRKNKGEDTRQQWQQCYCNDGNNACESKDASQRNNVNYTILTTAKTMAKMPVQHRDDAIAMRAKMPVQWGQGCQHNYGNNTCATTAKMPGQQCWPCHPNNSKASAARVVQRHCDDSKDASSTMLTAPMKWQWQRQHNNGKDASMARAKTPAQLWRQHLRDKGIDASAMRGQR